MTETLPAPAGPSAGSAPVPAPSASGTTMPVADGAATLGSPSTRSSDRYLTFSLSGEVFALPILEVTEIMEFRNLTVVPMMPAFLRGVINLRGRVVPVVDLAARFGRGTTAIARRTSIIILEVEAGRDGVAGSDHADDAARHLGILVDAVNKVVHFGGGDIEPPPAFGAGIRTEFISGMAKLDGEFVIILDVRQVLSLEELVRLGRNATGRSRDDAGAEGAAG